MPITPTDLVDRLAAHQTIGSAPREELAWLASHGALRHLNTGDVLSAKGAVIDGLFVVLSGRIAIFVDRGAGSHKVMEWHGGDVTGALPYSRIVGPPGDTVAQEPSEILAVHRDHFPEMIRECHGITSILVHSMLDRTRHFTTSDLHDEKMISLGKLSAGLAHELNNPASAIERSAALFEQRVDEAERASRALGALRLTEEQVAVLDQLRATCLAVREQGVRSPIEQAEREEAVADWLNGHGLDDSVAEALADTTVSLESLESVARAIDGAALAAVLRWAAAGCSVRTLASEIQDAALRISGLVAAIKGFTHMDRAAVAEPLDLLPGLTNTVAVLRSKARNKAASVVIDVPGDLPRVRGFAGELNQIWANLIDNALDAIGEAGRVEIRASHEPAGVLVRVIDNGSGIPDDIRARIFDPFYTTKPLGQGTGLGLDIVRRLVRHNSGDITVESRPGRTEFCVTLPKAESAGAGFPA